MDPFGDYATVHNNSKGPGDDRPTASQILQDEGLLAIPNRLTDKTVLITGGTSGLSHEIARALHATGARVFITGRCDLSKGHDIAASIESAATGPHKVQFVFMDLSDLDSVRDGGTRFLELSGNKVNLLICNAGVMAIPKRTMTKQDHETQFGVNYLAHFLLFKRLCPALLACSSKDFASRVVTVSSCAHRNNGLVDGGDYDFNKLTYNPDVAYGQSKTAEIYMAVELEQRYSAQNLHGLSVHPGVIMETGIVRHMTDDNKKLEAQIIDSMPRFAHQGKNAPQGAASIVWAASAAKLEGKGGLYLEDCDISQPVKDSDEVQWYDPGRASWSYDKDAAKRLWIDAESMLKAWL